MLFPSLRCKGEYAEKKQCEKFNIVEKGRNFLSWEEAA